MDAVRFLVVLSGLLSSGLLLHWGHYRVSACGRNSIDGEASIESLLYPPSIGTEESIDQDENLGTRGGGKPPMHELEDKASVGEEGGGREKCAVVVVFSRSGPGASATHLRRRRRIRIPFCRFRLSFPDEKFARWSQLVTSSGEAIAVSNSGGSGRKLAVWLSCRREVD